MTIIYDGLLRDDVCRYVRDAANDGYLFAVEISGQFETEPFRSKLKKRAWWQEQDYPPGQVERFGPLYRVIQKNFMHNRYDGAFVMLIDEDDWNVAKETLPVVNDKPFRVSL